MSSPASPANDEEIETTKDPFKSATAPQESPHRDFPDAFYDPNDPKKLMREPVVHPDGESYEKSTIKNDSVEYYPNRALKAIIEREVELASGSFRGRVRNLTESIRNVATQVGEATVFDIKHHPLPDSFYCPITTELIADPVITKEGFTYEKEAIVQWIKTKHVSPLTRNELLLSDVRNNNALCDLIQLEKGRTDDSIHPSIRRWKDSGADFHHPIPKPTENILYGHLGEAQDVMNNNSDTPSLTNPPVTESQERTATNKSKAWCFAISVTLLITLAAPSVIAGLVFFVLLAILSFSLCSCLGGCCKRGCTPS